MIIFNFFNYQNHINIRARLNSEMSLSGLEFSILCLFFQEPHIAPASSTSLTEPYCILRGYYVKFYFRCRLRSSFLNRKLITLQHGLTHFNKFLKLYVKFKFNFESSKGTSLLNTQIVRSRLTK